MKRAFLYLLVCCLGTLSSAETVSFPVVRERTCDVLTVDDVRNSVRFPDSVFCCASHMDIHRKGYVEYVTRKTDDPYFIPYRSLVARGVANLLAAGRCISAERPVMGAIRVMPPCFAMGQAAGTAAALSVQDGVIPRRLDAGKLVGALRQDGVYLPEAGSSAE